MLHWRDLLASKTAAYEHHCSSHHHHSNLHQSIGCIMFIEPAYVCTLFTTEKLSVAMMTVPENSIVVATNSIHGSKTHELLGSKSDPMVNSAWIHSVDCKMHDARKM
jgi:hypothetical protein